MHSIRKFPIRTLASTVAAAVALSLACGTARAEEKPGMVLKHIVMYKFKDDQKPEQIQEVVDTFAGLPAKIDKIIGFEHGTNVSQEGKSEGFTHVFTVTFRDQAGLADYLVHPAHLHYVSVVKDRREKVIVFDYWTKP
ncbi:MAG: Dabb family protein [Pirellulales bacterium]